MCLCVYDYVIDDCFSCVSIPYVVNIRVKSTIDLQGMERSINRQHDGF